VILFFIIRNLRNAIYVIQLNLTKRRRGTWNCGRVFWLVSEVSSHLPLLLRAKQNKVNCICSLRIAAPSSQLSLRFQFRSCRARNDSAGKVNSEWELNEVRKWHGHCKNRSDEAILLSFLLL